MSPSAFEVRVSGPIPEETLLDLEVVALGVEGSHTVLYGEIRDEATLFGLLTRLSALGLEVVEVRRTPHVEWLDRTEEPPAPGPGTDPATDTEPDPENPGEETT